MFCFNETAIEKIENDSEVRAILVDLAKAFNYILHKTFFKKAWKF